MQNYWDIFFFLTNYYNECSIIDNFYFCNYNLSDVCFELSFKQDINIYELPGCISYKNTNIYKIKYFDLISIIFFNFYSSLINFYDSLYINFLELNTIFFFTNICTYIFIFIYTYIIYIYILPLIYIYIYIRNSYILSFIIKDIYSSLKNSSLKFLNLICYFVFGSFLFFLKNLGISLFIFVFRICHLFIILVWQTIFFSQFTWLRWDYYLHFWPRYISLWHVFYFKSLKPVNWKDSRRLSHYYLCRFYIIYLIRFFFGFIYYYYLVLKQSLIFFLLQIYGDGTYGLIYLIYLVIKNIKKKTNVIIFNLFWKIILLIRRESFFFTQTDFWHRTASVFRKSNAWIEVEYDRDRDYNWGNLMSDLSITTVKFFSWIIPSQQEFNSLNINEIKVGNFNFINIFNWISLMIIWLNYYFLVIFFFLLKKYNNSILTSIKINKYFIYFKIKYLKYLLFFEFFSLKKIVTLLILFFSNWINPFFFICKFVWCFFYSKYSKIWDFFFINLKKLFELILYIFFGFIYFFIFIFLSFYSIFFKIFIKFLLFILRRRFLLFCLFIILCIGWPEFWCFIYILTKWGGSAFYITMIHFYESFIPTQLIHITGEIYISHLTYYLQLMNVHATRLAVWGLEMHFSSPLQKVARFLYQPDFYLQMIWEYNYFKTAYSFNRAFFSQWLAFVHLPAYKRLFFYGILKLLYLKLVMFYEWYFYIFLLKMLSPTFYYSSVGAMNTIINFYYYYFDLIINNMLIILFSFLNFLDFYLYIYDIYYFLLNCMLLKYLIFYLNLFLMDGFSFLPACLLNFFSWFEFIALSDKLKYLIWTYYFEYYEYFDIFIYLQYDDNLILSTFFINIFIIFEKISYISYYIYDNINLYIFKFSNSSYTFLKNYKNVSPAMFIGVLSENIAHLLDRFFHRYEFKPYATLYDVDQIVNTTYDTNFWYWYFDEINSNRVYELFQLMPNGWNFINWSLKHEGDWVYKSFIFNRKGHKTLKFLEERSWVPLVKYWMRYWFQWSYPVDNHISRLNWDFAQRQSAHYIFMFTLYSFALLILALSFVTIFMPCCIFLTGRYFVNSNHCCEYYWRLFKNTSTIEDNDWILDFDTHTEREILFQSEDGRLLTRDYAIYSAVKHGIIDLKEVCPNFRHKQDFDKQLKRFVYDFSIFRGYYFVDKDYEWFHQTMVNEFDSFNLFIAYAYSKNEYIKTLMREYDPECHEMLEYDTYGGAVGLLFEKEFWNKAFNYFMFLDSKFFNYNLPYWSYHKDQSVVCTTLTTPDFIGVSERENDIRRVIFEVENDEESAYIFHSFWIIGVPFFLLSTLYEVLGLNTTTAFEEFKLIWFHILLTDFSIFDYYIFALIRGYFYISFYSDSSQREYSALDPWVHGIESILEVPIELVGAKGPLNDSMYVYIPYLDEELEAGYFDLRFYTLFGINGEFYTLLKDFYYIFINKMYNNYNCIEFCIFYSIKLILIISLLFSLFIRIFLFFFRKDNFIIKAKNFRPYLFQLDSFKSIFHFFNTLKNKKKMLLKRGLNDKTKI